MASDRTVVRHRTPPHGAPGSRVLGFFAYADADEVFRFENACVVAGSRDRLRRYLVGIPKLANAALAISKIRFADVYAGLDAGAAYAFDREAYERFAPLARDAGIDVADAFPESCGPEAESFSFVKVRLADSNATPAPPRTAPG